MGVWSPLGYSRFAMAVFLAMVLVACSPGAAALPEETASPTETLAPPSAVEVMVDRIAYVSSAGDLFTVDPDGGNLVNLTGGSRVQEGSQGGVMAQPVDLERFYYWPTWAPDGSMLAASKVETTGLSPVVTVEILNPLGGGSRTVYQNEVPSLVAQGAPHYLYWSPDSTYLAFLASTPQAFVLLVANTQDEGSRPVTVETGAPLYFHWGAGGQTILLHGGDVVKLAEKPFESASMELADVGQRFRVAALSPDGGRMAYIGPGGASFTEEPGEASALFVADTARAAPAVAALDLGQPAAFAWSPGGTDIAVADKGNPESPIYDRLRVVSAGGDEVRTVVEETVVAFFWSPKGDQIAWVSLQTEERSFQWKVARPDGSDVRELFSYHPSSGSVTMLTFFDQYAYSHSPWSPDGTRLVVTGTQVETFARRNGETPKGDRVYVLDATGAAPARELAEGALAFWSWN